MAHSRQMRQGQPFASPEQTAADFARSGNSERTSFASTTSRPSGFWTWQQNTGSRCWWTSPGTSTCVSWIPPSRERRPWRPCAAASSACARHPAVFAYSVANEIPPDIVRWSGEQAARRLHRRIGAGSEAGGSRMPLHIHEFPAHGVPAPAKRGFRLLQCLPAPAAGFQKLPGAAADAGGIQAPAAGRDRGGFVA